MSQHLSSYTIKTLKCQVLPRPYVGSYDSEKNKTIIERKTDVRFHKISCFFVIVSISDLPTVKYCQTWKIIISGGEKIPKECILGDKCFISLTTIGGNLFSRHSKNINHVHKGSKDILSAIISSQHNYC